MNSCEQLTVKLPKGARLNGHRIIIEGIVSEIIQFEPNSGYIVQGKRKWVILVPFIFARIIKFHLVNNGFDVEIQEANVVTEKRI